MDLALLVANDTADCTILDPYTGDETEIVITVYGPFSKQYLAAFTKEAKRENSDTLSLLADLTVGWKGVELNGKTLPFNRANAIKAYGMENSIVRRQIEGFILNQKNFLPKR